MHKIFEITTALSKIKKKQIKKSGQDTNQHPARTCILLNL